MSEYPTILYGRFPDFVTVTCPEDETIYTHRGYTKEVWSNREETSAIRFEVPTIDEEFDASLEEILKPPNSFPAACPLCGRIISQKAGWGAHVRKHKPVAEQETDDVFDTI